jgi:hypothetical protein
MALASSSSLGVYRISGLLGKGGMEEVFRLKPEAECD